MVGAFAAIAGEFRAIARRYADEQQECAIRRSPQAPDSWMQKAPASLPGLWLHKL